MILRHSRSVLLFVLAALLLCPAVRADQDDNDADLLPTPEDLARATLLKRWPDATEIEIIDLLEDADDADDEPDAQADVEDGADPEPRGVHEPAHGGVEDEDEPSDEDGGGGESTLSATFISGKHNYEVLFDDDGIVQMIYRDTPEAEVPKFVLRAAREVAEGDFVYCDTVTDETGETPETSYIVGLGGQDVYLDANGDVIRIDDAEEPDAGNTADKDDVI